MTLLVISVLVVLLVSAACSVSEAALYAVRRTYVRQIAEQGSRAGSLLLRFKDNMEQPISAILIVNTVANTAGAAVAGAQAHVLFGDAALIWFSVVFTLCVLFLSEIMPKIVGVAYSRPVSRAVAMPWAAGIAMVFPVIWLIERLARVVKPANPLSAPEEEVNQLAMISAEEGSIMPYEADLVRNVLHLDKVTTRDIMTPRPVVMKLPSDMTLREVFEKVTEFTHSRIPVYDCDDPETWKGVVFSRDILAGLARDQFDTNLETLCSPIHFVSETTRGNVLLKSFLKRRSHLFGVADEYGDITGIVTLEDVIESMLGEEIVDEVDSAVDMQDVAQRRKREHGTAAGTVTRENVLETIVGAVEDEFDNDAPAIVEEGNGRFIVSGDATLAAVNLRLNLSLEADDADTLSGFLTARVGQVLQVGDKLDLQGALAEVVEVDGNRATKTRLTVSDSIRGSTEWDELSQWSKSK